MTRERILALGVACISALPEVADAQGRIVRELQPFRFEATSSFELDALANDVRRTDLDQRRWASGIGIKGRWRLTDGGVTSVCGDMPQDAMREGRFRLERSTGPLDGLYIAFDSWSMGGLGGMPRSRPKCPVSDIRLVTASQRLFVTLRALESVADTSDHGRDLLVLNALDVNGAWSNPVRGDGTRPQALWTRGGSLLGLGGQRGDHVQLGLFIGSSEPPVVTQGSLQASSERCVTGNCRGGGWPRGEAFITTLGHAIHAVGLSPTIDNRGRATLEQRVPLAAVFGPLGAVLSQMRVWICDEPSQCPAGDRGIAISRVQLTGNASEVELTFNARRRLSAIAGGWSPPARVSARMHAAFIDYQFRFDSLHALSVDAAADRQLAGDIERAIRNTLGYQLFPSWTGLEDAQRVFGTVCLFPVTQAASIGRVVTAGELRLVLDAPVSIQAIEFCPKR